MMLKRSSLPKWNCRNQADQDYLETWTNQQLDLIADRLPASLVRKDAEMHSIIQAMLSDNRTFERTLIYFAVADGDAATIERLTVEHPELRDFAVQLSTYKRGRGRLKNERRPDDWSRDEANAFPFAAEGVSRIRAIWKRYFGKQNRTAPPTAIDIAARRYGINEERFRNMLKNYGRRYSRYFDAR